MSCLRAGGVWLFVSVAVFDGNLKVKIKKKSEAKRGIEVRLLWEGNSFSAPAGDTPRHRTVTNLFLALYTRSL